MQYTTHNNLLDLWSCARTPESTPSLARLLQDATPPDDRNDFGETALHIAAAHGNDEAVQLLLHYGASLLIADWESGWTPLHRSLYHQHLSTSLLLLRHALTRFGKKFLQKYLHETPDYAQQSSMQLLSTRLHRKELENAAEACDGGLVYTFGKRDYQLGYHLPNADVQVTPRLVELPASSPIIQVSASKYHTIALNAAGECFVWGFGKGGRLGTGDEFDRIEPVRLASLETTPIDKVVAGENHTMALSRTGQVFSWGSNSFGQLGHPGKSSSAQSRLTPKRVNAFRFCVVADIAASGCHSAAIDVDDGAVYTWGSNRRGQLGRKEGCGTDQVDATPRSVDSLRPLHPVSVVYGDYESVRAEKVALSDWHTCVVLRCSNNGRSLGQVWQFGYGSYRPSRVKFPSIVSGAVLCDTWVPTCKQRGMDIVDVSCAQNHSIALSASGSVFTWGHNVPALSHQPIGSSRHRHADTLGSSVVASPSPSAPQKVPLSKYGPVNSVCASQDHCAVVTEQGDLVTWGCGQQGVLGHGRGNTWQPSPKRVAGVKKAIAVAAGHQHTAVLMAPVCPDFDAVADYTGKNVVPTLVELAEKKIAGHVDVNNCAQVWQYAKHYAALRLQSYCWGYMKNNWDAVLDAVGRERMEALFEIMLPPMEEPVPKEKTVAVAPIDAREQHAKKKKKAVKLSKSSSGTGILPLLARKEENVAGRDVVEISFATSLTTPTRPNEQRKSKSNKFVPLASFMANKTVATTIRAISSPWGLHATSTQVEEEKASMTHSRCMTSASQLISPSPIVSHVFPEAFPLLKSSVRRGSLDKTTTRQLKASNDGYPSASSRLSASSIATPAKHMLGYDGIEHEKVTAFSLDAFLKQPARRDTRGMRSTSAALTWNSSSTDSAVVFERKSPPPKTLKEIQEEEETAAAREREVKSRLGSGTVPAQQSQSTVNSWGLFRPLDHISLADVQKLQEKQGFLEQQRQILSEIEQEQAKKIRAAAATTLSVRSKQRTVKEIKGTYKAHKRGRKIADAVADGDASSAAASGSAGDNQSKQNKQKKVKERKAARKAAGETFAASGSSSISAARVAGREKTYSSKPAAAQPTSVKAISELLRVKPSQPRPKRKNKDQAKANA